MRILPANGVFGTADATTSQNVSLPRLDDVTPTLYWTTKLVTQDELRTRSSDTGSVSMFELDEDTHRGALFYS